MKCINNECPFKKKCFTYLYGEGEEVEFNTPTFKNLCKEYFPVDKEELKKITDKLVKRYSNEDS